MVLRVLVLTDGGEDAAALLAAPRSKVELHVASPDPTSLALGMSAPPRRVHLPSPDDPQYAYGLWVACLERAIDLVLITERELAMPLAAARPCFEHVHVRLVGPWLDVASACVDLALLARGAPVPVDDDGGPTDDLPRISAWPSPAGTDGGTRRASPGSASGSTRAPALADGRRAPRRRTAGS